ncbi:MAG: GntR family transcriptional regulator [Anaerolineaceae bacterium]|nr:GntR family transcriptional regulator [Anaerolineaceae bacterium]
MITLNFNIDLRSNVPAYVQIIESIQRLAADGTLKSGDQLPTVRQLAADLRVNFNTVARAYRMLDDAGLISTQHGRGTYLVENPTEEARGRLRTEVLENLVHRFLKEMERLDFEHEEVLEEIDKQFRSNVQN